MHDPGGASNLWEGLHGAPASALDSEGAPLRPDRQAGFRFEDASVLAFPWAFRGRLRIGGRDCVRFLQGLTTLDVERLAPLDGGWTFFLEAKGRVVADAFILRLEEGFLLDAPAGRAPGLAKHLERYIVAADVRIADAAREFDQILLAGRGLPEFPGGPDGGPPPREDHARRTGDGILWVRDGHTPLPGCRLWVPPAAAPDLARRLEAAGAVPAGTELFHQLRTEAARPWSGRELDESVLPVEARAMGRAVSLQKGCYLGQEVVARQHYLGRPRRLLAVLDLLEVPSGADLAGGAVRDGAGTPLGRLTSVSTGVARPTPSGLAVLKGGDHPAGARYSWTSADGSASGPAIVRDPPQE